MVKLRLRRVGKKKQPVYKIVAATSTSPRDGKFLESLGTYNPLLNPPVIEVKEPRLFYWLKRGAQATDTVLSLLKQKGLWAKWNLIKKGADEETILAEMEKWQALNAAKLVRMAEKKAKRKAKKKAAAAEAAAPAPVAEVAAEPAAS